MKLKIALAAVAAFSMAALTSHAFAATYGLASPTAPVTVSTPTSNYAGVNIIDDFDSTGLPSGFSLAQTTGTAGVYASSDPGVVLAPSSGSGNFYAILGGGSATLTTPSIYALSLELGSLDAYNSFTFDGTSATGSFSETITGQQLIAAGFNSTTGSQLVDFSFNGATVNSVVFASSSNSLEFDNLAVASAPEPCVWALMIAGLAMMGGALRLRRRQTGAVAA